MESEESLRSLVQVVAPYFIRPQSTDAAISFEACEDIILVYIQHATEIFDYVISGFHTSFICSLTSVADTRTVRSTHEGISSPFLPSFLLIFHRALMLQFGSKRIIHC